MPFPTALQVLWIFGWQFSPTGGTVERQLHVMGTLLTVTVEAPGPGASHRAAEAVVAAVERHDRLLTTWDPASPMSVLNAAPVGRPVSPDRELMALLGEMLTWVERTGRAFDPSLGALVDAWDLRGTGRVPSHEMIDEAMSRSGPTGITVDPERGTFTRNVDGAWMDTGAFGKGAALRAAADSLRAHRVRRALTDLGGQVLTLAAPGEAPWDVAVAHPSHRDEPVAWLRLADASVATSGNSERGLLVDGVRVGHILDPRTGAPVPWWGSATVVSADPFEADVLSTALYVMGPDAGLAWARDLADVGVLFLVEREGGLQTLHNRAMTRWLTALPATAGTQDQPSHERRFT